jgi:hypothetical protein
VSITVAHTIKTATLISQRDCKHQFLNTAAKPHLLTTLQTLGKSARVRNLQRREAVLRRAERPAGERHDLLVGEALAEEVRARNLRAFG